MQKLKRKSRCSSTMQTYYSAWKNFNGFFIRLDNKPKTCEDRLALYVTYLTDGVKRKPGTIQSYISGVKAILESEGIELNIDRSQLTTLVRACRAEDNDFFVRMPIQCSLMIMILDYIECRLLNINQPYLAKLYNAITVLGYFGMLRIGEMTTGTYPIAASDVLVSEDKRKLQYILRSSKMHGKSNQPQRVTILSGNCTDKEKLLDKYCPYQIILNYANSRPKYRCNNDPFFVFRTLNKRQE